MGTRHAIGIDIGGTKISVGLISESGAIVAQTKIPTDARGGFEPALKRIATAIRHVMSAGGNAKIEGIGIGCAGPLDAFGGVIQNDFTLPTWGGRNITDPLGRKFGVKAYLENDADVALVGEAFAGAGRGASALVMITLGTGVGGAAMVDGRIYRGADGEHPEIGHVPIDPAGPQCYCGSRGCLESIAAGPGIAAAARAAGLEDPEEVFAKAREGQPAARAIVDRAINAMAIGLRTLIHTFLPQRVIFGGGIMEAHYDLFAPALEAEVERATLKPMHGMSICRAELGNEAGMVGAGFVAIRGR